MVLGHFGQTSKRGADLSVIDLLFEFKGHQISPGEIHSKRFLSTHPGGYDPGHQPQARQGESRTFPTKEVDLHVGQKLHHMEAGFSSHLGNPLRSGPAHHQGGKQAGEDTEAKNRGKTLYWTRALPEKKSSRDHRRDVSIQNGAESPAKA